MSSGERQAVGGTTRRPHVLVGVAQRLALLVMSLGLVAATELTLRILDVGFDPRFFVPIHGTNAWTTNDRFGWRFFPPAIARTPAPARFTREKPANTSRIFVLGESAAMGTPDAAFSMGRQLEVLLEEAYPGRSFEVVNAAMTAISSPVIVTIAHECARFDPDLFVVYAGNNEVVGPYGPGTVFAAGHGGRAWIRASIWARGTRTGQLVQRMAGAVGAKGKHPGRWRGMEMFLGKRVPADDPRLPSVRKRYAANLREIVEVARGAGAKVVLATMATNLRDCPPFASGDGSANQSFREMQALLAAGRRDEALDRARRARDLDELRFRADTSINAIVRECARRGAGEVRLADVELALETSDRVPDGIPGESVFYEHVHLNFTGNYLAARALFDGVSEALGLARPEAATGAAADAAGSHGLTEAACAERLAFTPWNAWTMADVIAQMADRPPFVDQLDHAATMRKRLAELVTLERAAHAPEALAASVRSYRAALERRPNDLFFHGKLGELYMETGSDVAAAAEWRWLLEARPKSTDILERLGTTLARLHYLDQAIAQFQRLLELDPHQAEMHYRYGFLLEEAGRTKDARVAYRRALAIDPDHEGASQRLERLPAR